MSSFLGKWGIFIVLFALPHRIQRDESCRVGLVVLNSGLIPLDRAFVDVISRDPRHLILVGDRKEDGSLALYF